MLTRLYVDNYKALVNFDLRLGRQHLLLGPNGTGKSTVFEVLSALRRLQLGEARVEQLFPASTLTRWMKRTRQIFELEANLAGLRYRYQVVVEHEPERHRTRLEEERLECEGVALYSGRLGQGRLSRADGTAGSVLMTGPSSSALGLLWSSLVHEQPEHQELARFLRWVSQVFVIQLDPRRMSGRSESEATAPGEGLSNFASWYRHLAQERLNEVVRLRDELRQMLDGFDALVLKSGGEGVRLLRAQWRRSPEEAGGLAVDEYAFEELSDGQRALIGLYTLLYALAGTGATLCLDEPDNFVALREIQPFLLALRDQEQLQSLLVSHHPEVLNLYAMDFGLSFERVAGGPVRVGPFQAPPGAQVPVAELIARGWEHGEFPPSLQ